MGGTGMTILDRAEAQAHKPRLPYLLSTKNGHWDLARTDDQRTGSARVFEGLAKQLERLGLDEADLTVCVLLQPKKQHSMRGCG